MSLFAEYLNDNLLSINTTGRDDAFADDESYPYEPTPYCVLERLADSGFVTKEDYLIDFGCGKGRTCFYLNANAENYDIPDDATTHATGMPRGRTFWLDRCGAKKDKSCAMFSLATS